MTIQPRHLFVLGLLIVCALLTYDVVTSSLNPYVTIPQVSADSTYLQREIQVLASVGNFSFDDGGVLQIELTDGNSTMTAYYAGIPPQGLKPGQKIVAAGVLTAPGRLNATQLLVKCPSRYE